MPDTVSSRFSRRNLLIAGLGGTVLAASAGGWFLAARHNAPVSPTVSPTPAPLAGTPLFVYRGHRAPVFSVAWSPDSTRLVSASYDETAQVWDTKQDRPLITYTNHQGLVAVAIWSPDSKHI